MTRTLGLAGLFSLLVLCACSGGSASGGGSDAAADSSQACPGVCGTPSGSVCASQLQTSACLGGSCCILAADSGPPSYDDAGTCPGQCASPDDIACGSWFRSSACASGDLCCVQSVTHGDGGTD